jgi:hypothetical protein
MARAGPLPYWKKSACCNNGGNDSGPAGSLYACQVRKHSSCKKRQAVIWFIISSGSSGRPPPACVGRNRGDTFALNPRNISKANTPLHSNDCRICTAANLLDGAERIFRTAIDLLSSDGAACSIGLWDNKILRAKHAGLG